MFGRARTWPLGLLAAALTLMAFSAHAQAQDPQIVVVPYAPENLDLPYPAYEGARMTTKAILRNANCDQGYRVRWNTNRNRTFNDDVERVVTPSGGTVYDIGVTFTAPNVRRDRRTPIDVRVENICTGDQVFSTMRVFTYNWRPDNDPRQWSDIELEVMTQVGLHEALWYMHRSMGGRSGAGGQIAGYINSGGNTAAGSALGIWAYTINGRLPAYPPGTIDDFGQGLPNGWEAANDARWAIDPYSETATRMINYVLGRGTGLVDTNAAEEDTTCGIVNGVVQNCPRRLDGQNAGDGQGAYTNGVNYNSYYQGINVGALATVLPALAGTRLQVSGLAGQDWAWFIQQLTDYLAYAQIDGGGGIGGWYYSAISGDADASLMDASTAQWAYIGLESAEVAGRQYGVIVNNRHKYRIAEALVRNQSGAGGSQYRSSGSYTNNVQLTGGAFVGARWLGMHELDPNDNNTRPYAPWSNRTSAELRASFERTVAFTAATWNDGGWGQWNGSNVMWDKSVNQNNLPNYLCDNADSVYSWGASSQCGNLYAIYSHQKGYRTGATPQPDIGGNDWSRQFNTYILRSQDRDLGDYTNFGRISDCGRGQSAACRYGGDSFTAPVGALVLTPTIFNPKPIVVVSVRPAQVVEGCAGGNNGQLTFNHAASFHPNPERNLLAYRWDTDEDNGLWWEIGLVPNADGIVPGHGFVTDDINEEYEHTYMRAGTYIATLQVIDDINGTSSGQLLVQVDAAPNVAPTAANGGPYVLDSGEPLQLNGIADDGNSECGQEITVGWDLDNDGRYDDFDFADGEVPWATFQALVDDGTIELGVPHNITLYVLDAAGDEAVSTTQLTIYDSQPVAAAVANPNPARCGQEITFDASASGHPNPNREITQYQWDVDGLAGFDGGGPNPIFRYTYQLFGTYPVELRITDDAGRTATTNLAIDVNQGNAAPVARFSRNEYTVLEGDALLLDASGSTDSNAACGDSIVEYAFDLDGDGSFDDLVGQDGAPTIPWGTLATLQFPADPLTRLPANTVNLRVTDSFGATATTTTSIVILRADPTAAFEQTPQVSPIPLDTGRADAELDARVSASPTGGQLSYEWDTDGDGQFGDLPNEAVVVFRRIFNPVPAPGDDPGIDVTLRVTDLTTARTDTVTRRIQYSVGQTPPSADADPTDPPEQGYPVLDGDDVTLSAVDSLEPDENDYIRVYRWDLNYDADAGPDWDVELVDADADTAEALWTVPWAELVAAGMGNPGAYPVLLEVEDTDGLTSRDETVITVFDRAPIASIIATPNRAACGQRVTLDASNSSHPHPGVDVVSFSWDTTPDQQFVYDDAVGPLTNVIPDAISLGEPLVYAVQVTDTAGGVATTSVQVAVDQGNSAPAIDGGGPYYIAIGDESVTFDGSGTTEPDANCGDRIVEYAWDIDNDGTYDIVGADVSVREVTWAQLQAFGLGQRGSYPVRFRATDLFGAVAERVVTLNVVNGPTAVAEATPARVGCNVLVELEGGGSFSDGPAGAGFEIVSWEWTVVGQQGVLTGQRIALVADQGERVQASLTVTDAAGRTDSADVDFEIVNNNVAPVARTGGPYATGPLPGGGFAGVDLDARASSDPNAPCDEVVRWEWDTDDDGQFGADDVDGAGSLGGTDYTGAVVEDYVNPDWQIGLIQTVRVRACDTEGACGEPADVDISVLDNAPPAAEVIAPRNGVCVPEGDFDLVFDVSDPDGGELEVIVLVDGTEFETIIVDAPFDGSDVRTTITVDSSEIGEGNRDIEIRVSDGTGGTTSANSGGPVGFDRTPPVVTIDNIVADLCYGPGAEPEPAIRVDDLVDDAPSVQREVQDDACRRTVVAVAEDACGNIGQSSRSYRVAAPVQVELDGPGEGALVPEARITWLVDGPAECANEITARLSQDGVADRVYVPGTLLDEPGNYSLQLDVPDCEGTIRQVIRAFRVNGPPVPVSVPDDHPSRDNSVRPIPAYRLDEGTPLTLDGRDSRPPEPGDQVVQWQWDFGRDDIIDETGAEVDFLTDEDGTTFARLTVTDSLGDTESQDFDIIVDDVDPIVRPGGPYTVRQGAELQVDGRATRAGSDADAISEYIWSWGDGGPNDRGQALQRPTHTYAADGIFELRLTVTDEDSVAVQTVNVTVLDVNPTINGVTVPEDPFEGDTLVFSVDAAPGAPGDPLVSYEWDFDGDGQADVVLPSPEATWQYLTPGQREVTVTVRDPDSAASRTVQVDVRDVTLSDVLRLFESRSAVVLADAGLPARTRAALEPNGAPTNAEWVRRGLWSEARDYRGNTLMAFDELIFRVYRAQARGADFGDLLWLASREILREVEAFREVVAADGLSHPDALANADANLLVARALFDAEDYRTLVSGADDAFLARDQFAAVLEAYFHLVDARSDVRAFDGFFLPEDQNREQRVIAANGQNDDLGTALDNLRRELADYLAAGGEGDPSPGEAAVTDALDALATIQSLVDLNLTIGCPAADPTCIDDLESFQLQLGLMDLAGLLFAAADAGVYVRDAQNLVTFGIQFRVEVAILQLEAVCGPNTALPREARQQQVIFNNLVEAGQNGAALLFYISPERRCLVYREYNECIVPVVGAPNVFQDYPAFCSEAQEDQGPQAECEDDLDCDEGEVCNGEGQCEAEGEVIPEGDAPIPLRDPFDDLQLLRAIIQAFIDNLNPLDPVVVQNNFPAYEPANFDTDRDGFFTASDVDFGILMFIHDSVDSDGDGLIGIIENDCRFSPGGIALDPEDPTTTGVSDGLIDCDSDRIRNQPELDIRMNPLTPADALLDFDGDQMNNRDEIENGFDPEDHTDGTADADGDGLTNRDEVNNGLDPRNPADRDGDFDLDGLTNEIEVRFGLDPFRDDADEDPDGDGMSSRNEIDRGRDPLRPDCDQDPAELASGRNDDPENATDLGAGNDILVGDGVMCNVDPENPDQDWYLVDINEPNARVVLTLTFDGAEGNLDLRMFNADTGGQVADSRTIYDTEVVAVSRGQLNPGQYLVRVDSPTADQIGYALQIRVIPATRPCGDDPWEGPGGNDNLGSATILGGGNTRIGDAWVCDEERRTGDWYRVDVGQSDKTVHIRYGRASDGQLQLAAMNQDLSAFVEATEVQTNVQCINVRGGGAITPVFLNVTASTVFSDGDDRVDYFIQVVDTDLDANPRGACDTLSGGLFGFVSWPTLTP